jgi:hypothetical protein
MGIYINAKRKISAQPKKETCNIIYYYMTVI